MENVCDVNHLDADVLLPPRKRLLAGLKKQSSDGDAAAASPSRVVASCAIVSEAVASPPSSYSVEFEARLKNLLSSHPTNPNLITPEEVVEASKAEAVAAVKAARAARAAAEEKAEIAAKAVASAKRALDFIASFSEEAMGSKERNPKKNKLKKHLPVHFLYKKYQQIENCGTDEELARKLHRAMNSSPRISKNSPNSDSRGRKYKKPKNFSSLEMTEASDSHMVTGQDFLSMNNGHAVVVSKVDSEGSLQEACSSKEDKKGFRYHGSSQMEVIDNGEAEEKKSEDLCSVGKKRGRVKLKKLPLSICTSKDRAQPKEGVRARSVPFTENKALFPVESSSDRVMPIEATSTCKCQEFKTPACIKQSKAVQS
ncbi:uncharacterized protein LOC114174139 [Vigna unguiculata]|uniref:Uncharacterized protein n=1 Tax=Vigna unguiculata TaxID=3917 RepID=A0A4D6LRU3_VIGUN|nr:uncharacterized protein LOC114174139 [Vigna unguiculata]XP_027914709.1 uncharacterized protein LOC114174139 [Vigna unguiculata]XP_027914710.1 uncharacterized protein LOC114174139 [Vigna unguiculata]QCD91211.1 hypothetical protein DEO72_LG4g2175 [Vigna unguiculata]